MQLRDVQNARRDLARTRLFKINQLEPSSDDSENCEPFFDTVEGNTADPFELVSLQFASAALNQALTMLNERDAEILTLYYRTDMTLRQVGELIGITESRVSQIVKDSIHELRGHLSNPFR